MCTQTFGPMKDRISGRKATREIWINGHLLSPAKSLKCVKHSPDGFNWGYGGSGPAQLAFAILQELVGTKFALEHYMQFKWDVIASLPPTDFAMDIDTVKKWILATTSLEQKGAVR